VPPLKVVTVACPVSRIIAVCNKSTSAGARTSADPQKLFYIYLQITFLLFQYTRLLRCTWVYSSLECTCCPDTFVEIVYTTPKTSMTEWFLIFNARSVHAYQNTNQTFLKVNASIWFRKVRKLNKLYAVYFLFSFCDSIWNTQPYAKTCVCYWSLLT
jgi:hypothetical protein